MPKRKIIYFVLVCLFLLVFILGLIISFQRDGKLEVVFIDVGQGDSILISGGSQQILIDGGKDGKILLEKLGQYIPFWDRKIESIIMTHPDADHIGGLIDVFKSYEVQSVIKTEAQSDSQTFKILQDFISIENSKIIEAQSGEKIKFANGAEAQIIFPFGSLSNINNKDTNSSSVTMKFIFGENKFLFTGDLPNEQENEILNKEVDINSNVLKVAHHGSKYSSAEKFLKAVNPQDAIISVGKSNSYGHPHSEVLKRLMASKINVLRTDEIGDIVYKCQNPDSKCQRSK